MTFPFYEQAPKEVVIACNLCRSKAFSKLGKMDRYGRHAPTVECKTCGLVCLSERMTPEAYREFYQQGHYRALLSQFYGRPVTAHTIQAEQMVYAARLAIWLAPYMESHTGGLLLDLGGSTGVVAERLQQEFNLDATVVEPSPAEADLAGSKGLAVATMGLEDYDAGGNHYDLVTLCQTVDHLLDIRAALKRIRGWVKPGGLFFVDFVENGPIKIDHPYYLTRQTMSEYRLKAGFSEVVMEPSGDGLHVNLLCGVT